MDLRVLLESPQGSQSSSRVGACTCAFLPSCSSSVTLPFAGNKGSVAFPRGFPTRLSHEAFLQGCPMCHRCVSRSLALSRGSPGKQVSLEWTETSGGLWECGTTLEFLSCFLWRVPPLETRRERREFFPDHAGKGSLLLTKEAETGLLWMWAELSCFLSSGDGYVGELLELQQGCEGPFGSSRG